MSDQPDTLLAIGPVDDVGDPLLVLGYVHDSDEIVAQTWIDRRHPQFAESVITGRDILVALCDELALEELV